MEAEDARPGDGGSAANAYASAEAAVADIALLHALGNAPVPTLVLDRQHVVLYANHAFAGISPVPSGSTLAELLPELADPLGALVAATFESGHSVDREVLRPTREEGMEQGYWQASSFVIARPDGSLLGVGLYLTDISEDRRTARRLADSVARLDVTLAAGGLVTWDWDLLRSEAGWGLGAAEILGARAQLDDRRPAAFLDAIHPDDRDEYRRQIVAAARSASDFRQEVRVARDDGELQWVEVRGRVVKAADGTPRRMIGVMADVTERHLVEDIKARLLEREHLARVEAERARERLRLVTEVGAALVSRLDTRWIFDSLPGMLVPSICDWCLLDVLNDAGELEFASLVHSDAAREADVLALRRFRVEGGGDGIWSVRRSIRDRSSELVLDITDEDLADASVNAEHLAVLRRLAPRSAVTVPLIAHDQLLGGMTVVATHDRRFGTDDMVLMENVAGWVAMAIENARLFESRSQVTRALQQTLLPPVLPAIAGVDLVARYRVAADGIDTGGDFYDAFELTDGSWALVVGDVCGRGAEAAAVTGLFRHTVRAVAIGEASPARILRATNDAILGRIDDTRYCTAVFVALRLGEGESAAAPAVPAKIRASLACGGHPRPIVVRRDGRVERVEVSGTLLGILPEPALPEIDLMLDPGDAIVLYTDGVTEARQGTELFGEPRLMAALARAAAGGVSSAAGLADAVEEAVDRFRKSQSGDDIAIVVARISDG